MLRSLLSALLLGTFLAPALAAGDVSATLLPGARLLVIGDAAANDLQVEKDGATGEFVVSGRGGTTINGAASFRVRGVKTLRNEMGEGDDVVALGGFALAGPDHS